MHTDIIFDVRTLEHAVICDMFPDGAKRPWVNYIYVGIKNIHILNDLPEFLDNPPLVIPPDRFPELLLIRHLPRDQIITYFTTT